MSPRPQLPTFPPIGSPSSTDTSASTTATSTTDTSTPTTTTTSSTTTSSTTSTSDTSTTSSTTTSTTTSSTSTTTSSTTSTTSSTSSTTSTTPSSTSTSSSITPTTSASTSAVFTTTNSNGQVTTSTQVIVVTPSVSAGTDSSGHSSSSKGFFQNTGAVAGVFTVVGLVALVLFIAIVTNAVRRRRAKKLDREIAEAAAEAAGTTPAFTDDDYYPDDRLGKGGPGGDMRSMTTGYSDTTHGTFAQPPMTHGGESYNLAELAPYEYGAAAGAAGIGAMGLNRARSMGGANQTAPYNAFAGPQPPLPNPYDNSYDDPANAYGQQQNMGYRQRGPGGAPERDLLDAAGLGAVGGATAGYAAAHPGYGQVQNGGNVARNPSLGPSSATSPSEYSSYAAHPQQGYMQDYNPYQAHLNQQAQYNAFQQGPPQGYAPQAAYGAASSGSPSQQTPEANTSPQRPLSTVSAADPYGGYVDEPATLDPRGSLPSYTSQPPQGGVRAPSPAPEKLLSGNFASPPASSEGHDHDDHRASYQDEDDYGYEPKRVLKVANE
ncbi:hypothetical protein BD309DRAFT_760746 [Dichomitus squalens]|uniref:Uncharacterized protein n=2 Tax=Dichomitus squalens TaxID=114155 RepID=A0A4Q9PQ57_9APHY|nr:uncharacterized protein DICSQDRAFT_173339 [Dichomitus squalens LYAD-421 SS1]EJF57971.1 hypothetical protein DICSQDRAFT_173339 [Dichomitus squalens LYAD-421 SS1]TBU44963.1 hypothetical protein BD309DRAFT_760746 [Dichomitus squalens]TBU56481.1 hypothetical protein BD310DRAFT_608864 [Dichomitus squalens]